MEGFDRVVLVDAIQTGARPPGAVLSFPLEDLHAPEGPSPHAIGLPSALARARAAGAPVPSRIHVVAVEVVDMGREPRGPDGRAPLLSGALLGALEDALSEGGQAIVLHNRRGWATVVRCTGCDARYTCPSCGISLVLHRRQGRMLCHYCGFQAPFREACPTCGSPVEALGEGDERLEEALRVRFPWVAVARMHADTTAARGAHGRSLETFRRGETRILVGTQVANNLVSGGRFGYDTAGASRPNGSAEIRFDTANPATLVMKNVQVNPSPGIDLTGFNRAGNYLLSYNQDFDTGTVRIYGDYTVSGSTLALDYASQLYSSTATAAKQMRQVGAAATFLVLSTSDTAAVTQLVTMTWDAAGSSWSVVGSSTGYLGYYNTTGVSKPFPTAGPTQFMLQITYTTPADGDRGDFLCLAASQDQNVQKKLKFGKSATASSTWNNNTGRSKLTVAPGAGFQAVGVSTAPTLIDWLSSASTFYTFVDSGTLTLAYATVNRADDRGLQLTGTDGVSLSSSTFDYAGTGNGSSSSTLGPSRRRAAWCGFRLKTSRRITDL